MTPERWRTAGEDCIRPGAWPLLSSQRIVLLERADPELRSNAGLVASLLAQESQLKRRPGEGDAPPEDGAFLDRPAWEGRESLLKHDGLSIQAKTPVSFALIENRGEQLRPLVDRPKDRDRRGMALRRRMPAGSVTTARAHLKAGVRLGPYQLEALLGEGGMGQVFRARDTRLGRPVAIKVIRAERAQRPDFRIRFRREAQATAALNHPHICTLYDVGEQEGASYLVMEYVEGQTLAARLREGQLPLDQLLCRAIEVSQALAAAHERGIIHRDLKPANLMC